MKIIFMGTPEFSVPSLKALIEKHEVVAVLTQPDRPKGRGKKVSMSAVKEEAIKHCIPVFQPVKLRSDFDLINMLKEIRPDFIIVVAFGQILPKEVLDIPRYGCINLHASILPKYRGAAPINWAIINGESVSGNTTMMMNEGLDTGDILETQEIELGKDMTAGKLHDILMTSGAELLLNTIDGVSKGTIVPKKQNDSESSYASMLSKEMAEIDWNKSAEKIKNFVLGLNPWPVAFTHYRGNVMKIFEVDVLDESSNNDPGFIIEVSARGIKIATKEKCILVKVIQFPGGKPLKVEEFLRGNTIEGNIVLGK